MNETQNTIQKIEETLARQNINYSMEESPIRKLGRYVWIFLGILLLTITFITVTGWLTVQTEPVNNNYQINK